MAKAVKGKRERAVKRAVEKSADGKRVRSKSVGKGAPAKPVKGRAQKQRATKNTERKGIGKFLRELQALCTYEHLVVPENRRNEKLVDLTIVATWHVVDGIHRLSG